jgi:hypothetical protein
VRAHSYDKDTLPRLSHYQLSHFCCSKEKNCEGNQNYPYRVWNWRCGENLISPGVINDKNTQEDFYYYTPENYSVTEYSNLEY